MLLFVVFVGFTWLPLYMRCSILYVCVVVIVVGVAVRVVDVTGVMMVYCCWW